MYFHSISLLSFMFFRKTSQNLRKFFSEKYPSFPIYIFPIYLIRLDFMYKTQLGVVSRPVNKRHTVRRLDANCDFHHKYLSLILILSLLCFSSHAKRIIISKILIALFVSRLHFVAVPSKIKYLSPLGNNGVGETRKL